MSFFGGSKPAPPVAAPAPPTPTTGDANTSQAVKDQAQPVASRAANVSAGASGDPSLDNSVDPYSVRKKLLGA